MAVKVTRNPGVGFFVWRLFAFCYHNNTLSTLAFMTELERTHTEYNNVHALAFRQRQSRLYGDAAVCHNCFLVEEED